jgi:two-component system CheB/CheR fusion protein
VIPPPATPVPDAEADALLAALGRQEGLAYAGYQPASLLRRVRDRMARLGVDGFAAYRERLDADPAEHARLVAAVPVQRTEFFRDPECWARLAAGTVPSVLAGKRPGEPVRAWSAGCATGEEAYTLAMVLAEAAGPAALAAGRVTVFATDVSEPAVARARAGRYPAARLAAVPPALRERYFQTDGDRLTARPELRRAVAFARHDLLRDPPFGRLDLVACRNTLIYFTPPAKARVLAGFHLALAPDGRLFTGRAEHVPVWTDLFRTDCGHTHVYRPTPGGRADALAAFARPRDPSPFRTAHGRPDV